MKYKVKYFLKSSSSLHGSLDSIINVSEHPSWSKGIHLLGIEINET